MLRTYIFKEIKTIKYIFESNFSKRGMSIIYEYIQCSYIYKTYMQTISVYLHITCMQ